MLGIDMLFIFLWVIQPYIWLKTTSFFDHKALKIKVFNFTILFIILFQYLGLPLLYFQLDQQRSIAVSDKFIVFQVFIFTSLTILSLLIGRKIGVYFSSTNLNKQLSSFAYQPRIRNISVTPIKLLGGFSVLILIIYINKIGLKNLAFSVVLGISDINNSSAQARSLMGNAFGGSYHWYKLFMRETLNFSLFFFYAMKLSENDEKFKYSSIFYLLLIASIFSAIMATEKGPILELLIGLFLIYILVKNKSALTFNKIIKISFLLFVPIIAMYLLFMNSSDLFAAISSPFSRILTGQIEPAYHYLEIFPKKIDFLLGRSLPNPRGIFPFEPYNLTKEVMVIVQGEKDGITGSMPTIFWGEMYANFGNTGVAIVPVFVGLYLYIIDSLINKIRLPYSIPLLVWSILHFKALSGTSLSNFLLDLDLIVVFGFTWLINKKLKYGSK